jgi:polysaccharide pyruvyl transferase WcaK-like protein
VDVVREARKKRMRIILFGHFGRYNFGNDSTLQAILYHLRRRIPDAEVACICTSPEATASAYNIATVPIKSVIVRLWNPCKPLTRYLRKVFLGIPSEVCRWLMAFRMLHRTDMFIVSGTGLLTDAFGFMNLWGPYTIFKWSLIAKLCHCKLFFVSVGAGPIYGVVGRFLIKSALSFADSRSYRDNSTMTYLKGIGVSTDTDQVYPDLAFSLPEAVIPANTLQKGRRPVVGLGLMDHCGMYGVEGPSNAIYLAYLDKLVVFVKWLLAHGYDVRLLIGDIDDRSVTQEFRDLLKKQLSSCYEGRVIDEPVASVEQLLSQLALTDVVVATRFHNVLLALLLNKPAISISFHRKCASLMSDMGLSEYCQDINHLDADRLIEQFCDLEKNAEKVRSLIKQKTEEFRRALDEQYSLIFKEPHWSVAAPPAAI